MKTLRSAGGGLLQHKWMVLITCCSATFYATVALGTVSVALPTISRSFDASLVTAQWILNINPLITASSMLVAGYFGDRLGRTRVFIAGVTVFAVGSTLCGLAENATQLIVYRAVQSSGSAMVVANNFAIAASAFTPNERGRSLGIVSAVASLGLTVGPTVGGLIVASALAGTTRALGSALGVALGGAVFAARLSSYGGPTSRVVTNLLDPASAVPAFRDAYLFLAVLCVFGICTSLFGHSKRVPRLSKLGT